jgi:hypothetical protein
MSQPKSLPMNDMLKIVCVLISRPEAAPFRDPVDHKGLGLHDYLKIVKKPMDLNTIKKNIESGLYNEASNPVEECAADIRLVWSNCMLYNQDGSDFYHLALTFAKKFEDVFAQFRKMHKIAAASAEKDTDVAITEEDLNRIPTLDERVQLSYDIFRINHIEMGQVLTFVEKNSPAAIAHKTGMVWFACACSLLSACLFVSPFHISL